MFDNADRYKRDFWSQENLKFSRPHYRLQKASRIINKIAPAGECALLDVGCGPAALRPLLRPNIQYYGIDMAIHKPGPNFLEADFLETPIGFGEKNFDIVLAQGVFEYIGKHQAQKFSEIAQILKPGGTFIVSYVNFHHRKPQIYFPYSNIQSFKDFTDGLRADFSIRRYFPAAHNWNHGEPNRRLIKAANMHLNMNVPIISPILAVEYFFICTPRARMGDGAP
jgi:SAM-dependent methyltransferase